MTPLSQQTILVTGATDGLGRHLAEHLARSGARLLLHGRDAKRGADTVRAIHAATGNARLGFVQADFASLAEVHSMAARLAASSRVSTRSSTTPASDRVAASLRAR